MAVTASELARSRAATDGNLPWLICAGLALCALPFGLLGLLAPLIWLALVAIERSSSWFRLLAYLAAGLLMLVAALGIVPGSERIALLPDYSDAAGNLITIGFNPGKAVIAIALLPLLLQPRFWPARSDLPFIVVAIGLPIACGLLYRGPSLKFSGAIAVAIALNLLVVCISEEGFFRWVLQRGTEEALGRWRWLAVLGVTVIFTFLHTGWAASPAVLALVALAGLGYAKLWYLRQNLWLCILAHGGVNALHLILLPYPLN